MRFSLIRIRHLNREFAEAAIWRHGRKTSISAKDFWTRFAPDGEKSGPEASCGDLAGRHGFQTLPEARLEADKLDAEHKWFLDKWFIPFGHRMC